MRLAYYPGCSLKATGRAYEESTLAVAGTLDLELEELEDWNCCGATSYMSVRELLSVSISARNLSLAQRQGLDIVAPCSACFTVLRKADHYLAEMPDLGRKVTTLLDSVGLSYQPGAVRVFHLLEALVRDGGLERFASAVTNPLAGLRVAPYYGCQIVRPKVEFDDAELPTTLDRMISASGAEPVYYPVKTRCCGASLVASSEQAAFRLCKNLLLCAQQNRADIIVTLCPLCQMNLEAFQPQINRAYGTRFHIPVFYFTQLMGLAMGIPEARLGIGREIIDPRPVLAQLRRSSAPVAANTPAS